MAERRAKRTKATTQPAAPAAPVVGTEEWKEAVLQARARILGGRRADTDYSLERVAELVNEHDEAARRGDTKTCERVRDNLTDQSARDGNWRVDPNGDRFVDWDKIPIAVLMDIRRRLDTIIDRLPPKKEGHA